VILLVSILLAVFVVPSEWAVPTVVIGGVLELGEAWLWKRYLPKRRVKMGPETMIGQSARVETACLPDGEVRLGSELWAARCDGGAAVGETVVVRGREGLTLIVERAA